MNKLIELIPKVSLTKPSSWVEPAEIVCVSALELPRAPHFLIEKTYFKSKQVLISAIIPDDVDTSYLELLTHLPERDNIILTTVDCATYVDAPSEMREEQIFWMLEENHELFTKYKNYPIIGILKGVTAEEHLWVYNELKDYCTEFLIYLSGYLRSNPRWFNLPNHLAEILPNGFKQPLWCYGFNEGSIQYLSSIQLQYHIIKAITFAYQTKAIYNENPHYTEKVRMQKAWEKKLKIFSK